MIYIAGQPHVLLGGANSEAMDNVAVLRAGGIPVTLVPFQAPSVVLYEQAKLLGCEIELYRRGIFDGQIVAGWNHLPYLCSLAESKPKCAIYFNCMTVTSKPEVMLHEAKKIDLFGFVSNHQRNILGPELAKRGRVGEMIGYAPPITTAFRNFTNGYKRNQGTIGVLTRDDPTKVNKLVFEIAAESQAKRLFWMGYGTECERKLGGKPSINGCEVICLPPNTVSVAEFFDEIDVCLHIPGPVGESFCRIMLESFISGTPFVCSRSHAFPEYMTGELTAQMHERKSEYINCINSFMQNSDFRKTVAHMQTLHLNRNLQLNQRCLESWKNVIATYA